MRPCSLVLEQGSGIHIFEFDCLRDKVKQAFVVEELAANPIQFICPIVDCGKYVPHTPFSSIINAMALAQAKDFKA